MQKAQQARDKSVKQEQSTAQALSDAQHKHDIAVADEKKATNDLSVRTVIVDTPELYHSLLANHVADLFPATDVPEAPSGSPSSC